MIKYYIAVGVLAVSMFILSMVVSIRPNIQSFERVDLVEFDPSITVIGYRTVYTMETLIDTLMNKPGGYMSNDKLPPFSVLDDMPNWEYGALSVIRDSSIIIRKHLTRSAGAQALDDEDAVNAQTHLHINNEAWMFPSVEGWLGDGEYVKARKNYTSLRKRLTDDNDTDGNFYTRATSLADAIDYYNRILGNLSQRLSASTGRNMVSSTAGDKTAREAKVTTNQEIKTPWLEVDDVFWEAQGAAWALEEIFDAFEYDFYEVLKDKNALVTVSKIRDDLKRAQAVVLSPMTVNGGQYGMVPNYSLVLANYISRASATMTALKKLIENG